MNQTPNNSIPQIIALALIVVVTIACIAGALIGNRAWGNELISGENPASTATARQNTQNAINIAATGTVAAVQQTQVIVEQTAIPPRATLAAAIAQQTQAQQDRQHRENQQKAENAVLIALVFVIPAAIIALVTAFATYLRHRAETERIQAEANRREAEARYQELQAQRLSHYLQRDHDRKAGEGHKPTRDPSAHPSLGDGDRKTTLGSDTRNAWPDEKDKDLGKGNLPRV